MRQLKFTAAANDDLKAIAIHIASASHSRETATRFVGKLRDKCLKLSQLDGKLGTARPELRADIRSTPCQDYVIIFRYCGNDVVEIVTILHGSRDIASQFEA